MKTVHRRLCHVLQCLFIDPYVDVCLTTVYSWDESNPTRPGGMRESLTEKR